MARRRKGRPVHGWVVLDKPAGVTSAQAVARVRRTLDAAKAGHAGTLDPLATGILPIALGEATKAVTYLVDAIKAYRFVARWGIATATDDAEGEATASSDVRPSAAEIEAVLPRFVGAVEQVPPAFSAVKVDGKRAYALARADQAPALAPRTVRIESVEICGQPAPDHAEFLVRCGKGTYIRALARDIAVALGTVGHVASLRRTAVGPFTEALAISLNEFEGLGEAAAASKHLLPVETVLDDIPALAVTESEAGRLRRGQPVPVIRKANRECIEALANGAVLSALHGRHLVAFVRLDGRMVHPVRVLNH